MNGSILRAFRLNCGLSQAEVCHGICNQSLLSRIESGNCNPSLKILEKICIRLNIKPSDLYINRTENDFCKQVEYLKDLIIIKEYDKAILEAKTYLMYKHVQQDPNLKFDILRSLGLAHYNKRSFDEALIFFQDCQRVATQNSLKDKELLSYNSIGTTYLELGSPAEALVYFERAYFLYETVIQNDRLKIKLMYNLSTTNRRLGQNQKARIIAAEALHLCLKTSIFEVFGHLNTVLGLIHQDELNFNSAEIYFTKALQFYEVIEDTPCLLGAIVNLATAYAKHGRKVEASAILSRTEQLSNLIDSQLAKEIEECYYICR